MPAAHDGRTFYRTWIVVAINLIQFQDGLSLSQFLHVDAHLKLTRAARLKLTHPL